MSNITTYKTIEDVVLDFSDRARTLTKDMLTYAWDLGLVIQKVTDEAAYGDSALATLIEKLGLGKSTLYAYKKYRITYPDKKIAVDTFAEIGVPFRSICVLMTMSDENRAIVEEKLFSGEIKPDKICEYQTIFKQEEATNKLIEENESAAEIQANSNVTEEDVKNARAIKTPLYKIQKLAEKVETAIHDSESKFQDMDMISDDDLYASVTDVMSSAVDTIRSLFKVAEHWKNRIQNYVPETDSKEDDK